MVCEHAYVCICVQCHVFRLACGYSYMHAYACLVYAYVCVCVWFRLIIMDGLCSG